MVILAVFKAIAGACGGLLALEKFVELPRLSLMTAGYASLFLSLPIVFSIYRNFRTVEALQNRIGREESERKEKKRLIKEIETGAEHTYATDDHLASYTKPAA